ncbi:MAG: alpha/beta fold hydrolase [Myxococcota bacterium]
MALQILAGACLMGMIACSGTTEGDDAPDGTDDVPGGTNEVSSDCLTAASASFVRPFEVDPKQYPFDSCAFETAAGTMHYVDAGPKDALHTVLMVHSNPTWSFLYGNIAASLLADGHRVVIPDHLGMGMSDVPTTSDFDYRPRTHAQNLRVLVAALDLQDITLVVQDWGGPIGLDLAARQPERIGRILLMNTWAWSVDIDNPGYAHQMVRWYEQVQLAERIPDIFCRALLPGQAAANAIESDPSEGAVHDAVLGAYISPHIVPATGAYRHSEPCADADLRRVDLRRRRLSGRDRRLPVESPRHPLCPPLRAVQRYLRSSALGRKTQYTLPERGDMRVRCGATARPGRDGLRERPRGVLRVQQ